MKIESTEDVNNVDKAHNYLDALLKEEAMARAKLRPSIKSLLSESFKILKERGNEEGAWVELSNQDGLLELRFFDLDTLKKHEDAHTLFLKGRNLEKPYVKGDVVVLLKEPRDFETEGEAQPMRAVLLRKSSSSATVLDLESANGAK